MRVVIAEDEALSRRLLESALEALGHECISGRDGAHAWELFREHGADVIISDWMMPGLSGDELCRRVREEKRGSYTYFILLTGQSEETAAVAGERLRRAVEDMAMPHPGIHERKVVTISAGIATVQPFDTHDLPGLLRRADTALYRAKAAGRNRVMVAEEAGAAPVIAPAA